MDRSTALVILGIESQNPTDEEIKEAYLLQVQINHPDKLINAGLKVRVHAENQMKIINEAYDTLRGKRKPSRAPQATHSQDDTEDMRQKEEKQRQQQTEQERVEAERRAREQREQAERRAKEQREQTERRAREQHEQEERVARERQEAERQQRCGQEYDEQQRRAAENRENARKKNEQTEKQQGAPIAQSGKKKTTAKKLAGSIFVWSFMGFSILAIPLIILALKGPLFQFADFLGIDRLTMFFIAPIVPSLVFGVVFGSYWELRDPKKVEARKKARTARFQERGKHSIGYQAGIIIIYTVAGAAGLSVLNLLMGVFILFAFEPRTVALVGAIVGFIVGFSLRNMD